jgi:hypothetical protein
MSELINTKAVQIDNRWRLLTTVSALALLTASYSGDAKAEDNDRPTVWVELGGQLERVSHAQDAFTAPFLEALQTPPPRPFGPLQGFAAGATTRRTIDMPDVPFDISQPLHAQAVPENNFGEQGKLLFQPADSDWVFSGSVRYGRANGSRLEKQQTDNRESYVYKYKTGYDAPRTPYVVRFSNAQTKYTQSHLVLDFQAGKDVGLGLFGRHTQSIVGFGVRFAQFTSKSSVDIKARPQFQAYYNHVQNSFVNKYFYNTRFQDYELLGHSQRSFHGIGPSLSWSGSTPFIGNEDTAEFTFDWGVNAAVLFGRQKARADQKDAMYDNYQTFNVGAGDFPQRFTNAPPTRHFTRSRAVTVPNLGGFAGLSLKFPNAKVSVGYRADIFWGAMDAGIATRHTADMSFHGPFATLSIGLGG